MVKALLTLAALVDVALAVLLIAVSGFIFNRRGQAAPGIIVAWVPPAGALLAMAPPPPY